MDNEITLKVVDRNQKEHKIVAPTDMDFTLMEICKASDLPIKATCGGMALCSTCHVYVLSEHELPEMREAEEDMLDEAFFVEDNSRLSCQIPLTNDLDGLVVELAPENQD